MNSKPKIKEIFTSQEPSTWDTFKGRGNMTKKNISGKQTWIEKIVKL